MRYVYTAVTGRWDRLRGIERRADGWRYVCFTDGEGHPDWETRPAVEAFSDPVRNARAHKLRPDVHLPDAELSLWIDGNFEVTCDLDDLVERYLVDADLVYHRHPERDCVYAEALACIKRNKDDPEVIARQVIGYAAEGFPRRGGLPATGVVLRRHTSRIAAFNRRWAHEVEHGSRRDQLGVTYALDKVGLTYTTFDSELREGPLFRWRHHDGPG